MIKIELEIAQVNAILFALSKQPYDQVASLIALIQGQASPQVASPPETPVE